MTSVNKQAAKIQAFLKTRFNTTQLKLTCRISKTTPLDGLLNAAVCIKSGYKVIITDATGTLKKLFPTVPYVHLNTTHRFEAAVVKVIDALTKYFNTPTPTNNETCLELSDIINSNMSQYTKNKLHESYNVVCDQFVNQILPGFSLLTCGINQDRLKTAMQQKYGEKGDFNFINDIASTDILAMIDAIYGINNIPYELCTTHIELCNEYAARMGYLKNNFPPKIHKVDYPVCITMDERIHKIGTDITSSNNFTTPRATKPMPPRVAQVLEEFRLLQGFYDINWAERFITEKIAKMIRYCETAKRFHLNIAVSGGIDSAVVLMLVNELCKRDNRFTMLAILLPIDSTPEIQNRGEELCNVYNIPYVKLDFTIEHAELCNYIIQQMTNANITINNLALTYVEGCAKSNFRGFIMYCISLLTDGLTVGTGNQDEDAFARFYSSLGDGYVDISPIADVPKHFVYCLGKFLGVINSILVAAPSADLLKGTELNTDADEIGTDYTYAEFILFVICNPDVSKEIIYRIGKFNNEELACLKENIDKIVAVHLRSTHKIEKPANAFTTKEYPKIDIANAYEIIGIAPPILK